MLLLICLLFQVLLSSNNKKNSILILAKRPSSKVERPNNKTPIDNSDNNDNENEIFFTNSSNEGEDEGEDKENAYKRKKIKDNNYLFGNPNLCPNCKEKDKTIKTLKDWNNDLQGLGNFHNEVAAKNDAEKKDLRNCIYHLLLLNSNAAKAISDSEKTISDLKKTISELELKKSALLEEKLIKPSEQGNSNEKPDELKRPSSIGSFPGSLPPFSRVNSLLGDFDDGDNSLFPKN